ncbi:MAG: hypothetical protein HKM95_02685, partial [Inquilinus sp.]|nr:hypothetical protein [Inquilinus sp.]
MDKQDKRNLTRGAVAIVLVACLAFLLFWYVGGSPGDRVAIPERAATPGTVAPPTRSDAAAPDRPAAAPDRDAASTSAEPPTTAQPSAATPQTSADSTATALRDSPAANEPNLIEGQVASPAEDRPAAASGATATLPA